MKKLFLMAVVMGLGLAAQATETVTFYCAGTGGFVTPGGQDMYGYATLYAKESGTEDYFVKVNVGNGLRFNKGYASKEGWDNANVDKATTYDFYFVLDGASDNIDWVYTSKIVENSSYDSVRWEFGPHFIRDEGSWQAPPPFFFAAPKPVSSI